LQRFKSFQSTGVAPNGRLFAGDLNLFQDLVPALSDFGQTIDAANYRVGDTSLQLTKFGPGEGRFTGSLRADGILRGLSGIIAGTYTTAQRDAIAVGGAPYGIAILNTTTNQYEWNKGTDASRQWVPLGVDPIGALDFNGGASHIYFNNQNAGAFPLASKRSADSIHRWAIREDGQMEWGPGGGSARDTTLSRTASGQLSTGGTITANVFTANGITSNGNYNVGGEIRFADGRGQRWAPMSQAAAAFHGDHSGTNPFGEGSRVFGGNVGITLDRNARVMVEIRGGFTGPGAAGTNTRCYRNGVPAFDTPSGNNGGYDEVIFSFINDLGPGGYTYEWGTWMTDPFFSPPRVISWYHAWCFVYVINT
jgi:hypothetical protein